MRITIQVTCESPEDAQDAIARLTRPRTWVDDADARQRKTGVGSVSETRLDEIMGGSATSAEQSGSNDGATGASRPNISPGEPSIGKIGADSKAAVFEGIRVGVLNKTKFAEHLKLLWKRGEIKYDGAEYYL